MSPLPLSELLYANHLESPTVSECPTIVPPSHGSLSIVVDQLAEHASLGLVRELTKVDTALGVAFADQDAPIPSSEGDHMPRSGEIVCGDSGGSEGTRGEGPVVC
jgi:hypothetical protein